MGCVGSAGVQARQGCRGRCAASQRRRDMGRGGTITERVPGPGRWVTAWRPSPILRRVKNPGFRCAASRLRLLERYVACIHVNPVKHGWAKRPADWPHSTFHANIARDMVRRSGARAQPMTREVTVSGEVLGFLRQPNLPGPLPPAMLETPPPSQLRRVALTVKVDVSFHPLSVRALGTQTVSASAGDDREADQVAWAAGTPKDRQEKCSYAGPAYRTW